MTSRIQTDDSLTGEVTRLTTLVEQQGQLLEAQRLRLEALEQGSSTRNGQSPAESNGHEDGNGKARHSRRELLRLAGITAAGAAGAVGVTALQSLPAAAATGGTMTLGQANDADATTLLTPTTTAPSAAEGLLDVDGSKAGTVTASTTFFRAIRGIAPTASSTVSGVGLWGSSDAGAAVLGSSQTGVDFWSFNSGRILQAAQPAGAPAYPGGVYDGTNLVWTDFEVVRDDNGIMWIFLPPSNGSGNNAAPVGTIGGTWIPLQPGGQGAPGATGVPNSQGALFTAATTNLLSLSGSAGTTFVDMGRDTANGVPPGGPDLVLSITPAFSALAIITGNADLYTDTAGYNQDIGIYVNPSSSPAHIVAWKESGGFAGTNSPNAAFVQAVVPMTRGTTYDVRLQWKTNKAQASGAHIRAGAGPFPAGSPVTSVSPTRLTALLVVNP